MSRPVPAATPSARSTDVSLSELARALVAPGPREGAGLETPALAAQREARADLARALASLGAPVGALTSFGSGELRRGGALLRARVLRAGFGAAASLRPRANDLTHELAATENEADAASTRSQRAAWPGAEGPFRAFVLLTRSDRTLLSLLYASAQGTGADLQLVDDVARSLLRLRQREQAPSAAPREAAHEAAPTPAPAKAPVASESEPEANVSSHWLARTDSYAPSGYASAAFAARVVSSYRSLLPPAVATASTQPPEVAPEPRTSADGTRPFSAVQALGLGVLVDTLNKKQLVARRAPRRDKARARAGEERVEQVDADEAESEMRRFARWDELFRRRRAQRRQGDPRR